MSMYAIKPWFVRRLRRVEDVLVRARVSPDALTFAAIVVCLATGAAIAAGGLTHHPAMWLLVPPLVLIRLACNALDGSIARRTGRSRSLGAAINELGDRVGDAAMIGAAGFAAPPALATGAVAASFLASFTGVLALGLTGSRDYAGPMGKADRATLVAIGAAAGAIAGSEVPFVIVLWVIVAGGVVTAAVRFARMRDALGREGRDAVRR